jgi:acetoin utilization protein AcuC
MSVPVCVYIGDELAGYGFGQGHPFGPDRLGAFWKLAQASGLDRRVAQCAPVLADRSVVERFHTPEYVERVIRQSASGSGYLDAGDTPAYPGVYESARYVVGSVLDAVKRLLSGDCRRALVPIAGLHHARRDTAAGFCVFNDCGIAIETLRTQHGLQRLAYVDIDAHHGDGVFYSFESDPDLIFADLHEDGHYLYPGTGMAEETGTGAARGTKLNIPMPPEADDDRFYQAWERAERFIEAGEPAARRPTGMRRNACAGWQTGTVTAGCWPWAAAVTTAATSPGHGRRYWKHCLRSNAERPEKQAEWPRNPRKDTEELTVRRVHYAPHESTACLFFPVRTTRLQWFVV